MIDELIELINDNNKIVFFTGAGVSTLSGLKDFRSKDGLYNKKYDYSPEYMLSNTFFWEHTKEFFDFYRDNLNSTKYNPNIIHKTLKKLEDKNKLLGVITQNIDGFDETVGIKNLYEIHGSIKRNYCVKCHKFFDENYVFNNNDVPICDECGGIVKPDVVLYEEPLNENVTNSAISVIKNADLLIIAGTSLNVYPAAGYINYFNGKKIVLLNRDFTPYDNICNLVLHNDLKDIFEELYKKIN